jgi:hypothetical protein
MIVVEIHHRRVGTDPGPFDSGMAVSADCVRWL